jgi:hypothetical protein
MIGVERTRVLERPVFRRRQQSSQANTSFNPELSRRLLPLRIPSARHIESKKFKRGDMNG